MVGAVALEPGENASDAGDLDLVADLQAFELSLLLGRNPAGEALVACLDDDRAGAELGDLAGRLLRLVGLLLNRLHAQPLDVHQLGLAPLVADAHHPDLVAGLQRGRLLGQPRRNGAREHRVSDQVLDRHCLSRGSHDRARDPQLLALVRLPRCGSDERDDSNLERISAARFLLR